jgi:hypothetical protein
MTTTENQGTKRDLENRRRRPSRRRNLDAPMTTNQMIEVFRQIIEQPIGDTA